MNSMNRIRGDGLQNRKRKLDRICWFEIIFILNLILWVGPTDLAARQVTLQENFTDQDLSQNPAWTGDLQDFTFIEDVDNILLRLDTESSPNRSQIRTQSATAYGSWEFYVQVPATSSQNRVYFYLLSDDDELDIVGSGSPGVANGYAIHTGSDHFDLVKIENGQQTEILLTSNTEIEVDSGYRVKVTRDEENEWKIYVGSGHGSEPLLDSGSVIDQTFTESQYFGIYVRYSSTNVQGYYFDSIKIMGLEESDEENEDSDEGNDDEGTEDEDDTEGDGSDENGDDSDGDDDENGEEGDDNSDDSDESDGENDDEDEGSGDDENNDGDEGNDENDDEEDNDDSDGDDDENGVDDDDSEGDGDENGEGGDDSSDDSDESDDEDENGESDDEQDSGDTDSNDDDNGTEDAGPVINMGELQISEFYYRVPVHWRTETFDRPQYVEVLNRSGSQLNLRNLKISGENISINKDLIMEPGEYLVITHGLPVFEHRFGVRNFIEADQFPRFNLTTTGTITIENAQGETLEELTYSASEWGGNEVSLERFSFDLSADLRGNWGESTDALTGSPGLINTITTPTAAPIAESISVIAPRTLQVRFSRELDAATSGNLSYYSLDQGVTLSSIEFLSGGSLVQFRTTEHFNPLTNYTFTYQQVEDIFGNRVIDQHELNFTYSNPFKIQKVTLENSQQLRVQFTLPVNLSKSADAVFSLSDGSAPTGIQFINSETAILSFGTEFATGSYELIVNQIESYDPDLPEQWVIETNSSYPFYRFDDYSEGDIVINEFMYRPPNGYPRYVELYNRSGRFLNLKEWQLKRRVGASNSGGKISESDLPVGPGEFLVITSDSDLMEAIFGLGPWIEMTNFPGFTQTTPDQIQLLLPEGPVQELIEYEPSNWGGNGVALERRSLNAPASHIGNWGESEAIQLGTPGLPNSIGPLQQAPEWVAVEVLDSETIEVEFEGAIDKMNLTPNHFTLDGGLTVVRITGIEPSHFVIHLNSPMISGQSYTLRAQGITDIFGNVMSTQQRSVVYYHVEKAQPGDVVINEFMYNEPDDYSRYIELYNRSEKIIDLSGWSQANNTGTRRILTEVTTLLHPAEYLVITPDENLLHFFPDLPIVIAGNRISALKNGGDNIVIVNRESLVIDSLSYAPEWGGKSIALERKSANVAAIHRENWAESTAELLGTPGRTNTAFPDPYPPIVVRVKQFENRGFIVEFNKMPNPSSALNPANYQINHGVNIASVEWVAEQIFLAVNSGLVNNQTYTISMNGITDIFGNVMEKTDVEFLYLNLSDVSAGDIVINEILYHGKEAGSPEFVELLNRTDKNFDISGWTLSNNTGSVKLPDDLFMPAMEYLVFTDSGSLASQSDSIIELSHFRPLNNRSDIVKLSDPTNVTIDSLRYQSSWQNNSPGISLERRDPAALSIDPYNWKKSSDASGSTPGILNSQFEIDDQPPAIIFVNLFHSDSLEVIFNKFVDLSSSIENPRILGGTAKNLDTANKEAPIFYVNGEEVPILLFDPKEGRRVIIAPGNSVSENEMILSIENVGDHSGNVAFELNQPIARPLEPEDLIFNEIMYQPLDDGQNGMPGQSEFIEIYNRRPYAISIEGIFLHDEPDQSGNYSEMNPVNSVQKWIPSNGYLLFYPEATMQNFSESRVSTFFDLSEDDNMLPLRIERNSLSLPNIGRKIFLADSTSRIIDVVDYSPDWHNPNLVDNRGFALERINPDLATNDALNWSSSAHVEGGTPGQKNSIDQAPGLLSGQTGVFLNPNPFSPDGAGFEDHLFISYKLDEPDYLIRIRIFDRYGRLVRNLVHGEPAGFEGSYIWDGRTDDGMTNRIGIYIILLEAYNSSEGRTLQFKETAVLARKF